MIKAVFELFSISFISLTMQQVLFHLWPSSISNLPWGFYKATRCQFAKFMPDSHIQDEGNDNRVDFESSILVFEVCEMDDEGDVAMTQADLDGKFSQVFSERAAGEEVQEVDVISAIEFVKIGDHLATGNRGGHVVLFERNDQIDHGVLPRVLKGMDCSSSCHPEFRYKTEFQSHELEFDYSKILEIEEEINKIKWFQTANSSLFLLSTNDKTIKFWKVQEKKIKKICNFNIDPSNHLSNGFISSSNVHTSLRLPMVISHDSSLLARCRRTYAYAHDYHINSISNNRL